MMLRRTNYRMPVSVSVSVQGALDVDEAGGAEAEDSVDEAVVDAHERTWISPASLRRHH